MFMLDLQGDPQGLSIGGLVVITKSLSLTVGLFRERQLDLREELHFWLKSANFAIYYYFNFLQIAGVIISYFAVMLSLPN